MPDTLKITKSSVIIQTAERRTLKAAPAAFDGYIQDRFCPPFVEQAIPDGTRYLLWRDQQLFVVQQQSPAYRRVRWVRDDSEQKYGKYTEYREVLLSLPYVVTVAQFIREGGSLRIGDAELYFSNEPLVSREQPLCYPALLNVSVVRRGSSDLHTWVCKQYLEHRETWGEQVLELAAHVWHGGFNLSSEAHEGASWYQRSSQSDNRLAKLVSPVERWAELSTKNHICALEFPWLVSPWSVDKVVARMFKNSNGRDSRDIASDFHRYAIAKRLPLISTSTP